MDIVQVNRPGNDDDGTRNPAPASNVPKADLNRPVLITDAPVNLDDEWTRRRNRYLIMMLLRALCVIGASVTYTFSGWIAAGFIVGGVVLPWTAVVMANDRPPKEGVRFRRFFGGHDNTTSPLGTVGKRALESGPQTKFDPGAEPGSAEHIVIDPD